MAEAEWGVLPRWLEALFAAMQRNSVTSP